MKTSLPRTVAKVALILLLGMLVGLLVCLPVAHELFHEGLSETADCPVAVLQQGLALLFLCLLFLGVSLTFPRATPAPQLVVASPLPYGRCRRLFAGRAPPLPA